MRCRAQREALADDSALVVVLGVLHRGQSEPYLVDRAARSHGQLLDGDGVTVGEQPQQRDEQAGLSQSAEPLGQLHAEVRHRGFLQFVHAQHDRSDGSVVKALAAIRMPSAMVR